MTTMEVDPHASATKATSDGPELAQNAKAPTETAIEAPPEVSLDTTSDTTTPTPARLGHELPFKIAQPSSYLRPTRPASHTSDDHSAMSHMSTLDRDQMEGLRAIREFLKVRTSYDVLPLSFRLIILDVDILIKKSLTIMIANEIVSAPVWDAETSSFVGILTSTDYINVIQYYLQYPERLNELDQFKLRDLREVEKAIGVEPLQTISVNPSQPLYEACRCVLNSRARRIPLVDIDDETGRETVVSVITQYRILKFIAVNNEKNTILLRKSVQECGLGTYTDLATVTMDNLVIEAIGMMVARDISAVPVVDENGIVLNIFEAVDVIPIIQGGTYDGLSNSIGEALSMRADDFPGVFACNEDDRLDSIFDTIRKSRVHRLVVVDDEFRLKGMISLSDIFKYVLLTGEEED